MQTWKQNNLITLTPQVYCHRLLPIPTSNHFTPLINLDDNPNSADQKGDEIIQLQTAEKVSELVNYKTDGNMTSDYIQLTITLATLLNKLDGTKKIPLTGCSDHVDFTNREEILGS